MTDNLEREWQRLERKGHIRTMREQNFNYRTKLKMDHKSRMRRRWWSLVVLVGLIILGISIMFPGCWVC